MSDDLRARLVAAGVELVAERGTGALSLREVARRAGVSHGAPRRWFPTHRDLIAAVARVGYERLSARLTALVPLGEPRADLLALGRLYLGFARDERGMFELMFRHELLRGNTEDLRGTSRPLFALLVSLFGPGRADAATVAAAFWANLHGIAQLRAWGSLEVVGDADADTLLCTAVDAYLEH
ncbi:TetR/AcrR family transcriptional regulator [Couchioplanes azureus]|uniref:TetR/AcrR family transcriptional regulator n=1 Tax=Couchioplanes caeruleus TaxID=56438 RepID=UPI001670CCCB|nr:TetR/AcrR family transcriptional regulator [Couchioplanes caeruleus]GGQ61631.1 TetR family transcriptional regulator [Couchioplanes caeruleus subsp. azureus]